VKGVATEARGAIGTTDAWWKFYALVVRVAKATAKAA